MAYQDTRASSFATAHYVTTSTMRLDNVNMIPTALLQAVWQTHFAPYPFPNVTA
jgi:hypothetical protein